MFFLDGTPKGISWSIKTGEDTVKQYRNQAEMYSDKVSTEQARYIALHVGIFWSIGTFIIKNGDDVIVNLDSKSMYEHLSQNHSSNDEFIETRTGFIKQLIAQRDLKINYRLIEPKENISSKMLEKRIGT